MKTTSVEAELKALRTITDGPKGCSLHLLGRLRNSKLNTKGAISEDGHFGWGPCIEIYKRVTTLVQLGKEIPQAEVLAEDPSLSDSSRDLMGSEVEPVDSLGQAKALFDVLEDYRKIRIVHRAFKDTAGYLRRTDDPRDINAAIQRVENEISKAKSQDVIEIIRTGAEDNSKRTVVELIESDSAPKLKTGFSLFDRRTGGLRRGDVLIIAAPTNTGKSIMANQLMINMNTKYHYNVCHVNFEMNKGQCHARMYANLTQIPFSKIDNRRLSPRQKSRIYKMWRKLRKYNVKHGSHISIWCPKGDYTASQILAVLKAFGFDVILVDYIGLVAPGDGETEAQQLGNSLRTFKLGAGALNAAIVVLAQLDAEKKHIRYSRAMKEHCDFLWQWTIGDREKETDEVTVQQTKARNAPVYPFNLRMNFPYMRWEDIEVRDTMPGERSRRRRDKNDRPFREEMPNLSGVTVLGAEDVVMQGEDDE